MTKAEVVCVKQALGLKMRQICFVEKQTFLADNRQYTAVASAAKLLKVRQAKGFSHNDAVCFAKTV